ncbi:unnamed protein product [Caenorhabditis sp. 36 PRJEB53466]|nr:unnamed protein product [Caenorhabditis sp. 36 PRJEB53466]
MELLRPPLLLLLLLLAVDAFGARKVLKKVGKRFVHKWLLPATSQGIEFWFKTAAEINETREHSAQVVSQHLLQQSSTENLDYETSAEILTSLMGSDFVGGVCGGPQMEYYQLNDYWRRQREQYKRNDREIPIYKMLPVNDYVYNSFLVSFKQYSRWGFAATVTYVVRMELLGGTQWSNYSLTSIQEAGACTEYGTVGLNMTEVHVTLHETDPTRKDTQQKVINQIDDLFFANRTYLDEIPFEWVKLAARHEYLKASVCHDGALLPYTKYELIRWWKRFQIMWHHKNMEPGPVKIQLLGGEWDRFVFRVTMRLQIGKAAERPIEEWNFKVQVQFNVHGDREWYINKFEVMCPPISADKKLMEMSAQAVKEVIASRIGKMVEHPDMWYTATHFLNDFILKPAINILNCGSDDGSVMEDARDLLDLEHKFWEANKKTNGKMEGYDLGGEQDISPIGEAMWLQLYIIWTPLHENTVHESKWTFHLEWDTRLQFYHIVKMIFACPQSGKGNKYYSSLRQY